MITDMFIGMGVSMVWLLVSMFPTSDGISLDLYTQLSEMGGYLRLLDDFIPLTPFFAMLGIIFATDIAIWSFNFAKRLASHIPFVGGR